MMHRLRRYDVFRFAQNDVARFARNDAMFAQCAVRHTSLGVAVIIGVANIICRRQTSFKKRTFVGRQKCVFCWRRVWDSRTRSSRIIRRCAEIGGSANNIQIASNLEASSPFDPTIKAERTARERSAFIH